MKNTVLLVDDNAMNMQLQSDLLELGGFRVLNAVTAEDALDRVHIDRPDIVLMDVSLPGMDGLTATRLLKNDSRTAAIPVVALTAQAMAGDKEQALSAGCVGYIVKPIDTRRFAQTVRDYINIRNTK
ncbi:MAG TPA: response regulator [Verrucomicrobia bacterium]|nr:response regulator [Verrucomicrobiota bacterium]